MRKLFNLQNQIMLAMILGVICGVVFRENALIVQPIGKIFIQLLKMVMVPLIFSSLVVGVISLGSVQSLGRLGASTFFYYIGSTLMAVLMGLIVVNLIKPGIGSHVNLSHIDSYQLFDNHNENSVSVVSILSDSVPSNIVSAAASENMLGIIFFSLVFASALLALGSKGEQLKKVFEETNDVFLLITNWIMKLAPLGVFALLASLVGQTGLDIFKPVAFYVITVLIGLFLHLFVTLSGILLIIVKYSPLQFFKKVFPAIATAFSTASSIATLPVTMECLEKKVGVSKKVVGFVAPLGATVNMDGTALYEAVAAVFIAQVFGFDMSLTQQAIIMLTATLASVGAAGIPSAGLVTLAMVLQSVNLPLEGLGILLAVDRVLDMFRTTINVISDCVAALFVASLEGETFQSQETTQGYVSKN